MKYVIPATLVAGVIDWLQARLRPDPRFPYAVVSSIYYDDLSWRHLFEKINSDFLKTKVRVRWYSETRGSAGADAAFAEVKLKTGHRRRKLRVPVPFSGSELAAIPLADTRLRRLPEILASEGVYVAADLAPVFQVSYKRLRFVDDATATNCCFDYDIHAPRVNPLRLSRDRSVYLDKAVFEQKGPFDKLLFCFRGLTGLGLHRASFSKYSECCRQLVSLRV